ncbi:large conductance mechanosensitive channel protein MscL [Isoptericola sp. 4D.3]|uniref:Large-conductance mechanosensitive channel n=1 Tax=Isoptericola peretonis TaxID=2918523 RepID=A0ABT0J5K8_9MICO|nr:large conductance mechanosensitive channel protein MscL [Isoptericola sp. 4D.3]
MFDGFKAFIMRGSVVDLAVGLIIGSAFTAVVTAMVDNILNPIIGAIFGKPDLTNLWDIRLRGEHDGIPASVLSVGGFLDAVLNFLIVAAALYFAIVMPLNKLAERRARGQEEEPEPLAQDTVLLQEIRDLLAAQSGRPQL